MHVVSSSYSCSVRCRCVERLEGKTQKGSGGGCGGGGKCGDGGERPPCRFLRSELIARKREELQASMVKLGVEIQQPLVVAGGVASLAGHVDHQGDLALQKTQGGVHAVDVHGVKRVKTGGGSDDGWITSC